MPFLGSTPPANYKTLTKQTITGDSSTAYTLNEAVANANELEVFVNNVRQQPTTDYTANNRTITFTDPLLSSDSCWLVYQGKAESTTIAQTSNIADGAVTNAKISGVAASKLTGALPAIDGSALTGIESLPDAIDVNASAPADSLAIDASGNVTLSQGFVPSTQLSNRNAIINGGMDVWQRGTSFSSNVYTADRWIAYAGSGHSITRSTDVPSGSKYSLSFTGTGDSAGIRQNIEGKNCTHLAGNDVTVSFYLKQTSGAGTGVLKVALAYATAEDNFGGTTYISQPTIDTSSSWTKYTLTYSSIHADSKNGLQLAIKNAGTGTVTFLLSQVQLEVGSVATPFEHRSYGEELARCQRYFQRYGNLGEPYQMLASGVANINSQCQMPFVFPQEMRASPTASSSGTWQVLSGTGADTVTALNFNRITVQSSRIEPEDSAGGFSAGSGAVLRSYNDGTAYFQFDAEL